jgi:hypothetical protein
MGWIEHVEGKGRMRSIRFYSGAWKVKVIVVT